MGQLRVKHFAYAADASTDLSLICIIFGLLSRSHSLLLSATCARYINLCGSKRNKVDNVWCPISLGTSAPYTRTPLQLVSPSRKCAYVLSNCHWNVCSRVCVCFPVLSHYENLHKIYCKRMKLNTPKRIRTCGPFFMAEWGKQKGFKHDVCLLDADAI